MDKKNPDISVVIPAYNIENYIERAIQSALTQENVSVEVIVIDDCSTDKTVERARAISDDRLRVIVQPQNGGPSVSRNTGFEMATGEWIAILDGDDVFNQGRLARCLLRARQIQADCIVDNLMVMPENGEKSMPMFNERIFNKKTILSLADFIKGNQLFLGGYTLGYLKPMFRKAFLKEHALTYSTDIRIGEDYLFMAENMACGAKCVVEPSVGYLYTVRSTSISHRLNAQSVERIERADTYFLSKYTLSSAEMATQKTRSKKLREAFFFTEMVSAIKSHNIKYLIKTFIECPVAIVYLWRPIWVKLGRLVR